MRDLLAQLYTIRDALQLLLRLVRKLKSREEERLRRKPNYQPLDTMDLTEEARDLEEAKRAAELVEGSEMVVH